LPSEVSLRLYRVGDQSQAIIFDGTLFGKAWKGSRSKGRSTGDWAMVAVFRIYWLLTYSHKAVVNDALPINIFLVSPADPKARWPVPNTEQGAVRLSHELHRNNFMMRNLGGGSFHGTRRA
jgi:hypothetical protein